MGVLLVYLLLSVLLYMLLDMLLGMIAIGTLGMALDQALPFNLSNQNLDPEHGTLHLYLEHQNLALLYM